MRAEGIVSFPVPLAGLIKNLPPQNVPPQGILDGLNVFVDQDGFLKPRFGYAPLKDLVNSISGSVTIASGSTTATVVMPIPQPNDDYPIIFGVRPTGGAPDVLVWASNRTQTGFDVEISADPTPGSVTIDWYVPRDDELAGTIEFTAGVDTLFVSFPIAQTATNYGVTLGVIKGSGAPSGNAATWESPTLAGFTIHLAAAPGVGESIFVAWNAAYPDPLPNETHGTVSFTGATAQQTVALALPQADTSYQVVLGAQRGSSGLDVSAVIVTPTVNGFDIRISAAPGAETVEIDWHVSRLVVAAVGEPILGGISFYDALGTIQYVIATQTSWWSLSPGGAGWVNITDPAAPNTGSLNDQVRFLAVPYLGDIWVIGVNNTNSMRAWHPGLSSYVTVTAAPIARDICMLGSRVVAVNTVESGTRYSYRVRWSNVDDFTSWPALSVNDLTDQGQPIVAVKRVGPNGAAIYGVEGIVVMTSQPGTDATAFHFDEVKPPDTPGPCSPADVVSAVGLHYYMGLDARIYQFDGQSVVPISKQVDSLLQAVVSLGFASRFHAVYYPSLRQIWFFFVRSPDDEPRWAIVYDIDALTFSPLQQIADFATTSFPAIAQVSYTWLTWVSATDTWLTIPYPSWSAIPNSTVPIMILGTSLGKVERFGFNTTDDGDAIPYTFVSSLQRLDPNMKQLPNTWDIFFQKQPVAEQVTVTLSILAHPTATPRVVQGGTILYDVSQDTPQGFYPGANAPVSGFATKFGFFPDVPPQQDVYLQMTMAGSSTKRLVFFGGSECFAYTERRA